MFFGFGLLILLVVFAFYKMSDRNPGTNWTPGSVWGTPHNVNSALRILNERYAKGEISQEEYRTKKQDLTK